MNNSDVRKIHCEMIQLVKGERLMWHVIETLFTFVLEPAVKQ